MRRFLSLTVLGLATASSLGLWTSRSVAETKASDEVKEIKLPDVAPNLPPGKGLETVNAACVICHSTRYITMQPAFPRKTWVAEVDKMRKTFGAPVSDEQAAEVVEYLVMIRGTDETKGK